MSATPQAQEFTATLHNHKLKVSGKLTFPTPGYKAHLKKQEPQGINPAILLLHLTIVAPTGIEPDHIATVEVHFEEHTTVHYKQVQILPNGPTINVSHAHAA